MRAVGGGATDPLPEGLSTYTWSWPPRNALFAARRSGAVNELVVVDPVIREVRPALADFQTAGFYASGQLSPDGRWASASEFVNADRARIIVFPFGETPVPPADWISLTEDQAVEEEHIWSPQSDAIYFVSERDGARCIWRRRMDPVTKRPVGPVESILHLHGARRSMISTVGQPARIALGENALFFSVEEARGNIWKATVKDK
jgi:Tol biopolymer transport system component